MFSTPSFKKSLIVEKFQGNYLKGHVNPKLQVFVIHENSNEENEFGVYFAHFGFAKEKNGFYDKKSTSGENNSHLP